jgi:guanyl-specific ribonuclease Sa
MRQLKSLFVLALVVFAAVWWQQQTHAPAGQAPAPTASVTAADGTAAASNALPSQVRDTLQRIAHGGPFRHRQDGGVFGNYEGLLPPAARGYYHEYTVETPGADNRGARRIITGGTPPVVYYYTDDHYRSFRRIPDQP